MRIDGRNTAAIIGSLSIIFAGAALEAEQCAAMSHLVDFDRGSASEMIIEGSELVREMGDTIRDELLRKASAGIEGDGEDQSGTGSLVTGGDTGGLYVTAAGESEKGTEADSTEEKLSIKVKIGHTSEWDKNREKYNLTAAAKGLALRDSSVFWPGEVIVVEAEITGSEYATATCTVSGSGVVKTLSGNGSVKKAEIPMTDIPGAMDRDRLELLISAADGKEKAEYREEITIDDSVSYWMLHRKEAF